MKKSAVLDSSGDANVDPYNRGTSRPWDGRQRSCRRLVSLFITWSRGSVEEASPLKLYLNIQWINIMNETLRCALTVQADVWTSVLCSIQCSVLVMWCDVIPMMRNNDLRETSDERWRRPAAAEAAHFPEELRRSRCTRLINYPNCYSIHGQLFNQLWHDSRLFLVFTVENLALNWQKLVCIK